MALESRVRQAVDESSSDPVHPPAPSPPAERWWGNHLGEFRWQLELARLLADPVFRGEGVPRGDGAPVVLIPGFLAGDSSLAVMRGWLGRMGYEARRSGIVSNPPPLDRTLRPLSRERTGGSEPTSRVDAPLRGPGGLPSTSGMVTFSLLALGHLPVRRSFAERRPGRTAPGKPVHSEVYPGVVGRTNIDIDDDLIDRAMRTYRVQTKREAVDLALRRLVGGRVSAWHRK